MGVRVHLARRLDEPMPIGAAPATAEATIERRRRAGIGDRDRWGGLGRVSATSGGSHV